MDVGVDTQRYPIHDPESPVLKALVHEAQEQLRKTGCARFIHTAITLDTKTSQDK
jgi:hypothetical protein